MIIERKDLLGLEDLSREEIATVLEASHSFKEINQRRIKKVPILRGKTIANLFFEPSTRTRASFELAQKRLSADSINFSAATSSVLKGETLRDTAENIQAMNVDMIVIRHASSGAPHFLARLLEASVINAGDGQHEHPTQGLLDLFTLWERWGSFEGKNVTIVGDIKHSRVARSNIWGLTRLGARVTLCGPPTMMPVEAEKLGDGGCRVEYELDRAIEDADAINVMRIQLERQKGSLFPGVAEYSRVYGLNSRRLDRTRPECLVLHPGPMNRGVEISQDVADGDRAVILEQVLNGVAVRMAVIYLLAGRPAEEVDRVARESEEESDRSVGAIAST
jgi:aspartate carbamoyltransferase catalytic subunit